MLLRRLAIENYKSIVSQEIELGRVNVFIGENGCGKSALLEAVAMAAAAACDKLDSDELYYRGVRIAKPTLTRSAFPNIPSRADLTIKCGFEMEESGSSKDLTFKLLPPEDEAGAWQVSDPKRAIRIRVKGDSSKTAKEKAEIVAEALDKGLISGSREEIASALQLVREALGTTGYVKMIESVFEAYSQSPFLDWIGSYLIYCASTPILRGLITGHSRKEPLGTNGENLDVALSRLGADEMKDILRRCRLIPWIKRIQIDEDDQLKLRHHKMQRSSSRLYFTDRHMRHRNNILSAENANEGVLHVLFCLATLTVPGTPNIFAIDNIDPGLNPMMCRELMRQVAELAKQHGKQVLVTTHNPAVLDGINLHDPEQRLFVVARNDLGHTTTERIMEKPQGGESEPRRKLSELWMRGRLGGLPKEF